MKQLIYIASIKYNLVNIGEAKHDNYYYFIIFETTNFIKQPDLSAKNEYRSVKHDNDCYNSLVYTTI